jgi:Ca2+-binding EF-hand superfamily protein
MEKKMKRLFTQTVLVIATAAISLGVNPSAARAQADRPQYQELLKRFDRDGDGRLNEQERQLMRQEVQKRSSQDNANRPSREEVIKRYDKNGDGRLDAQELAALRAQLAKTRDGAGNRPPNQNRREGTNNRSLIERFDTNKNGRLDPEEQQKAREAMQRRQGNPQQRPPQPENRQSGANREQILQRFDANGNGRLEPEELQKARAAFEQNQRRGGGQRGSSRTQGVEPRDRKARLDMSALLEKYDADKDGRLDADERRLAMDAMRTRSGK